MKVTEFNLTFTSEMFRQRLNHISAKVTRILVNISTNIHTSVTCEVTGYEMDNQHSIPDKDRDFYFCHRIQTAYGTNPMGTGVKQHKREADPSTPFGA
jgi:hypothetical protein